MKTKIFTLFVIISMSTMVMAQSSQLATLNHKGQITTFYGATALTKAHEAATHGDVITLSSGSFNGVDITKAVTIRGAGMGLDTVSNAMPTIINSDFMIDVPSIDTANLIMEGIYHNGAITYKQATRPMFIKCRFSSIDFFAAIYVSGESIVGKLTDATFMHCYVMYADLEGSSTIINSVFSSAIVSNSTITNSILLYFSPSNSIIYNSIIGEDEYCNSFDGTNLAYYCVAFDMVCPGDAFEFIPNNSTNMQISYSELFESYEFATEEDDNYGRHYVIGDNQFFNLSKNAKEQYKGNDGTEVGIYGGNMPFDPRTTMPQITKCNVAAKSTADGKLSVDIEVSGIE